MFLFITRFTDWMYLFPLFYIKIKRPQIGDRGLQFDLFLGWDKLSDNITTILNVDHNGYRVCRLSCFLQIKHTFCKFKKGVDILQQIQKFTFIGQPKSPYVFSSYQWSYPRLVQPSLLST